jgi:Flp pilus assembly protein TadD/cell division septation protein DedD
VTKNSRNFHPKGCRDRALAGVPVAFVLSLLLAACAVPSNADRSPVGEDKSAALLRAADDTRAGGDLANAAELYRRVHEMRPKDPVPLGRLAATLAQLHDYPQAARSYREAIELAPEDADLHRGLAITLLSMEHMQEAQNELQTTLAKHPDDARLYNALGVTHDLMGRHDLAQSDYRNGLQLAPKNDNLRNNYGLSLALSGDYTDAVKELREVAGLNSGSPRYRLNLALVYGLAGDDERAASLARTALDEAAVRNNLAYYAMLRAMDDKSRAAAIIGGQMHGDTVAMAAAPTPAPVTAVEKAPLPNATVEASAQRRDKSSSGPGVAAPPTPQNTAAASSATTPEAAKPEGAPATAAQAVVPAAAEEAASAPVKLTRAEGDATEPKGEPTQAANPEPKSEAAAAPEPKSKSEGTPVETATATEAKSDNTPAQTAMAPAASAPAPRAAKPASPAAKRGFAVQLGSFASEANAQKLAEMLNVKGYDGISVVHHRDRDGRDWYAVRTGGYDSAEEAGAAARRIHEMEQLPAVVVHLHIPSQA